MSKDHNVINLHPVRDVRTGLKALLEEIDEGLIEKPSHVTIIFDNQDILHLGETDQEKCFNQALFNIVKGQQNLLLLKK